MMNDTQIIIDDHTKITEDLRTTKSNIATMNKHMHKIFTTVQTTVKRTIDDIIASSDNDISIRNNSLLQKWTIFSAENMDLM